MAVENMADRYGERVPTPHRYPRYRSIADELRRRITAGAIPAGALIPSEGALTAEFQVARGTIRQAIDVLRDEGLVITEHGRGTYARPTYPFRRIRSDRYSWTLRDSTEPDQLNGSASSDSGYRTEAEYQEVEADGELAALFEVNLGCLLLKRRILSIIHGVPQELTSSYYLLEMVAGTPIADPLLEPWPGGHVAQLKYLGVTVTRIHEVVRVRMPTKEEMEALRLPAGVPLLTLTRRTLAEDRVVEAGVEILFRGDRTELSYEIRLAGS